MHYIAADITTAAGCAHVAPGALNDLGGIDIIVNVLGDSQAPAGGFAALDDVRNWLIREASCTGRFGLTIESSV